MLDFILIEDCLSCFGYFCLDVLDILTRIDFSCCIQTYLTEYLLAFHFVCIRHQTDEWGSTSLRFATVFGSCTRECNFVFLCNFIWKFVDNYYFFVLKSSNWSSRLLFSPGWWLENRSQYTDQEYATRGYKNSLRCH